MHRLPALATLALAFPLLTKGGSPAHLGPRRMAPLTASVQVAPETTATAEVTPLRLTTLHLRRMTTFMAALRRDPAHLHALMADTAHYVRVPRQVGAFRPNTPTLNEMEMKGVDTLLDLGALAATDPVVAAAFTRAHLAPALYLPFATALQDAETTEVIEIMLLDEKDTAAARPADLTNVHWQNVAFLRAHRGALEALALPVPPLSPGFIQFLDTTQHQVRIRHVASTNTAREPYPWGFLDSADAPAGSSHRSAARPYRVLFVGNSLTYVNSLPEFFSTVAAQGLKRRVVVGLVSLPGASGAELWSQTDFNRIALAMPWDAIVVQIRPNLGKQSAFPYYTKLFTQASATRHRPTVFWIEWEHNWWIDHYPKHPNLFDSAWVAINVTAKAAGASVTPIPRAFAAARQMDSTTWQALFQSRIDGHPSALGSYLAALTIYQTLTGRSPMGLPRTFKGFKIELPRVPNVPGFRTTDSLTIPEPTAALLQRAAAAARR